MLIACFSIVPRWHRIDFLQSLQKGTLLPLSMTLDNHGNSFSQLSRYFLFFSYDFFALFTRGETELPALRLLILYDIWTSAQNSSSDCWECDLLIPNLWFLWWKILLGCRIVYLRKAEAIHKQKCPSVLKTNSAHNCIKQIYSFVDIDWWSSRLAVGK